MSSSRKRSRQSTIPMMFGQPARNNYTRRYRRGTFYRDPVAAQRAAYGEGPARSIAFRGVVLKGKTKRALGDREERYVSVGSKGRRNFNKSEILQQVYNAFSPTVTFEHRLPTFSMETVSNEQLIQEIGLNLQPEMTLHFDKLKQEPPNIHTTTGVPPNITQQLNVKHVYEGGSYTYTIKNTCVHTVFIEARVMKPHVQVPGQGLPESMSPFRAWEQDEANNNNGDSWFLNTNLVSPANGTAKISSLSTYNVFSPSRSNNHFIHNAGASVDIRPKKTSSRLHRLYDLESTKKMVLKPGETVFYTVNMPKFWNDGLTTVQGDGHSIQRYSRILWFFVNGEMVTDTTTDTALMAPGSSQLTVSCLIRHKFRTVNFVRTGLKIVSSGASGDRGNYDNIVQANEATINEETNTEQIYAEIGLTNN